jgi:predicted Fe-Mo cluster-binding NifX family protein
MSICSLLCANNNQWQEIEKTTGSKTFMQNPEAGEAGGSIVAEMLINLDSSMVAGNMDNGAFSHLSSSGISVYRGCSGNVRQLAEARIQGNITDSGSVRHHHEHEEGHQCNHEKIL